AIDSSGSMMPKLETVQKAVGDLLKNLNSCDEVAIVEFSGGSQQYWPDRTEPRARLIQPFTTDRALVSARFAILNPAGQTPLYDAVREGLEILGSAHYEDRALILITDGVDTASQSTKEQALLEAETAGTPIYGVGIGDPNGPHTTVQIGPFVLPS